MKFYFKLLYSLNIISLPETILVVNERMLETTEDGLKSRVGLGREIAIESEREKEDFFCLNYRQ